jgi:energy-converting hydrogenase Eha subunit A
MLGVNPGLSIVNHSRQRRVRTAESLAIPRPCFRTGEGCLSVKLFGIEAALLVTMIALMLREI